MNVPGDSPTNARSWVFIRESGEKVRLFGPEVELVMMINDEIGHVLSEIVRVADEVRKTQAALLKISNAVGDILASLPTPTTDGSAVLQEVPVSSSTAPEAQPKDPGSPSPRSLEGQQDG